MQNKSSLEQTWSEKIVSIYYGIDRACLTHLQIRALISGSGRHIGHADKDADTAKDKEVTKNAT